MRPKGPTQTQIGPPPIHPVYAGGFLAVASLVFLLLSIFMPGAHCADRFQLPIPYPIPNSQFNPIPMSQHTQASSGSASTSAWSSPTRRRTPPLCVCVGRVPSRFVRADTKHSVYVSINVEAPLDQVNEPAQLHHLKYRRSSRASTSATSGHVRKWRRRSTRWCSRRASTDGAFRAFFLFDRFFQSIDHPCARVTWESRPPRSTRNTHTQVRRHHPADAPRDAARPLWGPPANVGLHGHLCADRAPQHLPVVRHRRDVQPPPEPVKAHFHFMYTQINHPVQNTHTLHDNPTPEPGIHAS